VRAAIQHCLFLACAALCVVGCASGGLVRLDAAGTMESRDIGRSSGFPAATVVLAEMASIQKIVITPRYPLRKIQVLVRVADGSWQAVSAMEGRFTRPITVRTDIEGDAVRVLDRNPAAPAQRGPHVAGVTGAIDTVLVYGRPVAETAAF
jgi:hypothetical protein